MILGQTRMDEKVMGNSRILTCVVDRDIPFRALASTGMPFVLPFKHGLDEVSIPKGGPSDRPLWHLDLFTSALGRWSDDYHTTGGYPLWNGKGPGGVFQDRD